VEQQPIRVTIVDDHTMVRDGLRVLLCQQPPSQARRRQPEATIGAVQRKLLKPGADE
jgi:DNA-binding NarL/FixJ family response regulator